MGMEALEMNRRIIRFLVAISFILSFSITQIFVIHEQRNEMQEIKNQLTLLYQEYDYYDAIEINSEAMILQDQAWAEIERITKLDFTAVLDDIQQNSHNHDWVITAFHRLEEKTTEELKTDELKALDSNNLVKNISIDYEMEFIITNGNIVLPLETIREVASNIRINSITLIVNDEEINGVLNISYSQQEIMEDSILEI